MVLDFDKVCRLCLEISSNSIFYPGNSNGHPNTLSEELVTRIFQCTALKVSVGEGLPESVCDGCVGLLDKFILFRKMCREVDDKLRQYFFSPKEERDPESFSILPNPVRLDPQQMERSYEPHCELLTSELVIKGECHISNETFANHVDDNKSGDESVAGTKKSASKDSRNKYKCSSCKETFKKATDLTSHMEEEHTKSRKEKPVLVCQYCSKSFKQLKRFKSHLATHEASNNGKEEEEDKQSTQDGNSDGMDSDSQSQTVVKEETGEESAEQQTTAPGRKRKIRKVYDCEYCDQVFHSHAKYTQHELTHTGEKKYNCSDCSRSFTHKHSLIGHIKEQHTGEVNYTCDVCGRGFVHQSTFNIHKKTHSTEKPLKCPECDKCFTQMKNLRVHRQIHSAQRSHTCQVCGKSFNFMKTLKVHLVLHSGEKPFVCTYCGKAFAQSAPLKTHTRIHTGEKPYQCTICPLRFSTNNALKSHILKHSGEAPYSCSVCNKGFSRKKDMVAHQEEQHGVHIGLPGASSGLPQQVPPQHVQDNCLTSQANCLPPPPPPHPLHNVSSSHNMSSTHLPPPLLPSPHQSPAPQIQSVHHLGPPQQLHTMAMPHQPPHLTATPVCLPHLAYYPPQQREPLGTNCSDG